MEFVEEESRPRFLFHSRISTSSAAAAGGNSFAPNFSKLHFASCLASASALLFLALFVFSQSQTLTFPLIWTSLSLLLGPFAPASVTGGDVRVGNGEILDPVDDSDPPPQEAGDDSKRRALGRRSRARRSDEPSNYMSPVIESVVPEKKDTSTEDLMISTSNGSVEVVEGRGEREEEKEWTEEDFEVLKKRMSKHPVGTPRRWELIAEAFGGRHCVESVIRTAKSLSEKRPGAGDSFTQFLRQRKPLDKQAESNNGELSGDFSSENGDLKRGGGDESVNWSTGEDIALLNALKVFPKDVSMRWEKIAAAVPGKSKACCMRRVAELKKDFRSSKAS